MAKTARKSLKIPARDIERTVLENGVRVISECVKGSAAAVISVGVDSGSRFEPLNESGSTHLIQRMALHGAGGRGANEIAKEIQRLGGDYETSSGRDAACYLMRVEPELVNAAAELLADISLRPELPASALKAESDKLLEELRAQEKDAEYALELMFLRSLWKGHGLCRAPRGRLLTIKGHTKLEQFKPQKLARFHEQSHHPEALTVIATGAIEHSQIESLATRLFGGLDTPKKTVSTVEPTAFKFFAMRNRPQFSKVRFELGFPVSSAVEKERHVAGLLHAVVAGGAGSRLPLQAREGTLPVLSVSSHLRQFADVGCMSIRARAEKKHARAAVEGVVDELWRVAAGEIDDDELAAARAIRKTALLDEFDSLRSRAAGLARRERYHQELITLEHEFSALERVTAKQLHQMASIWIGQHQLALAVLGNTSGVDISPSLLNRRGAR